MRTRFWRFIHNAAVHPLMGVFDLMGLSPAWVERWHDWTGDRGWGGE